MKSYPLEYPTDIPSGLVPSKCTGCKRLWWITPPPDDPGRCMCCKGKLRFLVAVADTSKARCTCQAGSARIDCPVCGQKRPAEQRSETPP